MGNWVKLILRLLDIFGMTKKSPREIKDEASDEVAGTTIDDDIAGINRELLDRS